MSRRPNTLRNEPPIKIYGFALIEVTDPDFLPDRVIVQRPPGQLWWNAFMTMKFPINMVPELVTMAKGLEDAGA